QRVVVHRERRVADVLAHVGGVPEGLVPGSPVGDAGVALALAERVPQVDVGHPDHPDRDDLDEGDGLARGVDHHLAVTGTRQRLAVALVVVEQPGRRGLRAVKDRGHQLIAERAGERELPDAKPSSIHASQRSGPGRPSADARGWRCPGRGVAGRWLPGGDRVPAVTPSGGDGSLAVTAPGGIGSLVATGRRASVTAY